MMENVLISGCLLGLHCRYDGMAGTVVPELETLQARYHLIPVCPEQLGGMATPRAPSERCAGRVVNAYGEDVTQAFVRGAEEVLHLARLFDCKLAILKERSPSCGSGSIYDGTFSHTLTDGWGVCAQLLRENGITVIGESMMPELLRCGLQVVLEAGD